MPAEDRDPRKLESAYEIVIEDIASRPQPDESLLDFLETLYTEIRMGLGGSGVTEDRNAR